MPVKPAIAVKSASNGWPPNPDNVYVGTFKVLLTNVAAPLEPVVVKLVILFVYAVSHSVCFAVVGIA